MKRKYLWLGIMICLVLGGCSKKEATEINGAELQSEDETADKKAYRLLHEALAAETNDVAEAEAVQTDDDFEIEEKDGEITIIGYTGKVKDVVIPATIKGLPVIAIGDGAFSEKKLTSVSIADSVIAIGRDAFAYNQLTSVSIPNNVTSIGDSAFYDNNVTSISIPESVKAVGSRVFYEDNLVSVNIGSDIGLSYGDFPSFYGRIIRFQEDYELNNKRARTYVLQDGLWMSDDITMQTIGDFKMFVVEGKVIIYDYIGNKKDVDIPSSLNGLPVTAIARNAFSGKQLTSVNIPNGVRSIGRRAFYNNKLTSMSIPDSLITIAYGVFEENELESVSIPESVSVIDRDAFVANPLTEVSIGKGVRLGRFSGEHNPAFSYSFDSYYGIYNTTKKHAGTYVLQDGGWKNISMPTFGDFEIEVANGKITITGYNGSAKDIVIPPNINGLPVIAIDNDAFHKKQLISVSIPDSIITIGDGAFSSNQVTSIRIPMNLTTIRSGVFSNNELTSVSIPNSVTSIGDFAFSDNLLTSVNIPDSVTSIGDYAFLRNKLTSVSIGSNVPLVFGIYRNAFDGSFVRDYNNNGRLAGTYVLQGGDWSRQD